MKRGRFEVNLDSLNFYGLEDESVINRKIEFRKDIFLGSLFRIGVVYLGIKFSGIIRRAKYESLDYLRLYFCLW